MSRYFRTNPKIALWKQPPDYDMLLSYKIQQGENNRCTPYITLLANH